VRPNQACVFDELIVLKGDVSLTAKAKIEAIPVLVVLRRPSDNHPGGTSVRMFFGGRRKGGWVVAGVRGRGRRWGRTEPFWTVNRPKRLLAV